MPWRNATTRLIAAHLSLVALSTVLALGFVYWSAGGVVDAEMRQVVEAEARGLADDYGQGGVPALAQAIERRVARPQQRDAVYLLAAPSGARVAGNLAAWPPTLRAGDGWTTLDLYRVNESQPTTISALSIALPRGERLLVGRDVAARAAFDRTLLRALVWALAGLAALTAATGWLLSRMVLRRIDGMAATAHRIMRGALDERAPAEGTGDEFDRLARALNAMLDRISALVEEMRLVTDSLAHDIRSPLGRLIRRIEAAQAPGLEAGARAALLEGARAEAQTVLDASSALLDISRIEAGIGADQFAPLDLADVARDLADLYGAAAEEQGMTLRCEAAAAPATGHAQLLAQAGANLIENALRHARAGGAVAISAGADAATAWLAVEDRGPGVAEGDRPRVLKPFARLDPARSGEGSGLGLTLVAAVARMHGAALTLEDGRPGLRAVLRLPRRA